jgi:threonine dehydrogenase-like Zn-dependent dehydrogenase
LQIIPDDLSAEDALFLPNMETAVNFIMDGRPVIGERVVVLGQGTVGLLTTALLAKFPLENLVTLDHYDLRRHASLKLGADRSLDPANPNITKDPIQENESQLHRSADLVYELSGNPDVLNQAIEATGYEGRIVVGSWYGVKKAHIDLGGWFHRGRLKLISSQVSQINSIFNGSWDKTRRFDLTWEMLGEVKPAQLITHKYPIQEAEKAFAMLADNPGDCIQVLFEY